ncbi:hypothetical protein [Mycolicibacterium tusciae]|uniref:hypothetical protein n=1 Tax=Mycolicibacterium tusciae TaxID=75922 RepID=UPI0013FE43DF|nr:hypothetical protein [Mycolicibacterium tusciae]
MASWGGPTKPRAVQADEHPEPPYEPPEPTEHTWTHDDELARMEHRKALAAPPTKLTRRGPEV